MQFLTLSKILLLQSLLFLVSCTEIGPVITPQEDGSGSTPNMVQRVFVEEFSGVRCVNCPAGSTELAQLAERYPERLVVVSIHAGFFSNPYPENRYDFRTAEGNNLLTLLGQPLGYPSAVINRRTFEGEADLHLSRAQWAGFIAQELQKQPQVAIELTSTLDRTSRELRAVVDIKRLSNMTSTPTDVRLSVFLTENNLLDAQLTPEGKKTDYLHQHVLRKALTPYDGILIGEDLKAQGTTRRSFMFTLPLAWNANECNLIAVVHRSGDTWEVLQAMEVSL